MTLPYPSSMSKKGAKVKGETRNFILLTDIEVLKPGKIFISILSMLWKFPTQHDKLMSIVYI